MTIKIDCEFLDQNIYCKRYNDYLTAYSRMECAYICCEFGECDYKKIQELEKQIKEA